MNAPLGFGLGNTLHPMPARFKLKAGVHRLANEAQHHFFVTTEIRLGRIHDLDFPALALRKAGIHAQ